MMHRLRGFAWALAAVAVSGCGSDGYEVVEITGSVTTCEGQPATGGTIIFTPRDAPDQTGRPAGQPGPPSMGTIAEDGTFTLMTEARMSRESEEGALTGPHTVTFQMPPTKPPTLTGESWAVMSSEEKEEWKKKLAEAKVYKPLPCTDKITPGEVVVSGDSTHFEFTLPKK